jgi:hypothetical protein
MKYTKIPTMKSISSERFVPSQSWIAAFDTQCTELLLKRARHFAACRARDLGWAGPGNDAYYADELVQNAVTDTLLGVLRWDPNARTFQVHLYDAIRLRVRRDAARAQRFPHQSIDVVGEDGESQALAEAEARLLAEAPEAPPETATRAADTAVELKKLAKGKRLVLRLLDAFADRATTKEDAMRVASMSRAEYHNARRQLARLVDQLPEHLKPRRRIWAKGA